MFWSLLYKTCRLQVSETALHTETSVKVDLLSCVLNHNLKNHSFFKINNLSF